MMFFAFIFLFNFLSNICASITFAGLFTLLKSKYSLSDCMLGTIFMVQNDLETSRIPSFKHLY